MIYSYLITHIDKNQTAIQALEEITPEINHKIQIINSEENSLQNFLDLLQKSMPIITEKADFYNSREYMGYGYYYFRKTNPATVLRGIKPGKNAIKLIECLYLLMKKKFKDWDHFLSEYSNTLLQIVHKICSKYDGKMTEETLMKISKVIEDLDNWSTKANYELKSIYLLIKKSYERALVFRLKFRTEIVIEEIGKQLILKQEERANLHKELQNAISFKSKF